jgi:DNA-binding NarL/FixJ family response regulator
MAKKQIAEKIEIVIVEDDSTYRNSLQEIINTSENLTCTYACKSCEEVLSLLADGFLPAVIMLDIKLPGMSGIEGIEKIKLISPATQIVILTVFDDDEKIFNAICSGASGYLLKSAPLEKIATAIQDVLSGGAVMSPSIAAKMLNKFAQNNIPKQEYGLTQREKEILQCMVNGMSKKHISEKLFISYYTVDTHLKNIYAKLHVHSQIDVIAKTLKEHLL